MKKYILVIIVSIIMIGSCYTAHAESKKYGHAAFTPGVWSIAAVGDFAMSFSGIGEQTYADTNYLYRPNSMSYGGEVNAKYNLLSQLRLGINAGYVTAQTSGTAFQGSNAYSIDTAYNGQFSAAKIGVGLSTTFPMYGMGILADQGDLYIAAFKAGLVSLGANINYYHMLDSNFSLSVDHENLGLAEVSNDIEGYIIGYDIILGLEFIMSKTMTMVMNTGWRGATLEDAGGINVHFDGYFAQLGFNFYLGQGEDDDSKAKKKKAEEEVSL